MTKPLLLSISLLITLTLQAQPYQENQRILSTEFKASHFFSAGMAVNNDYLMLGASFEDTDADGLNPMEAAGAVYIYQKDESNHWAQSQKIVPLDREAVAGFGYNIRLDGDYAIIGAYQREYTTAAGVSIDNAGTVYVFKYNSSTDVWEEVQKIITSDLDFDETLGDHIAIEGDVMVIGVNRQDTDTNGEFYLPQAGAAYVFERNTNGVWVEMQKLTQLDRLYGDQFGNAVAIDNNIVYIGSFAKEYTNQGAVYTFKKNANNVWEQQQKIVSPEIADNQLFGYTIAVHQNSMAISAARGYTVINETTMPDTGAVYMFEYSDQNEWAFTEKIQNINSETNDAFGESLALNDSFLLITSRYESSDENGENELYQSGTAYIYTKDNAGSFSSFQKIIASDRAQYDLFGKRIDYNDNEIFVSSDLKSTTVDGVFYGNTGAAYVYSNEALSVSENTNSPTIKVYPNPASSLLNIAFSQPQSLITMRITDALGRHISFKTYDINPRLATIDVSALSTGNYFVSVTTNDFKTSTYQFIKH